MRRWLLPTIIFSLLALCGACATHPPYSPRTGVTVNHRDRQKRGSQDYQYSTYYVRKGDTLYSIARRMKVDPQSIRETNQCDPHDLKVGQILLIPVHARDTSPQRPDRSEIGRTEEKPLPDEHANGATEKNTSLHRGNPSSAFWWPVTGTVTRRFGDKTRGFPEPGVGIRAAESQPVRAVRQGTVICAIQPETKNSGWGNVVAIEHKNDIVSWYARLSDIAVKPGQHIEKGQKIGSIRDRPGSLGNQLALRLFRQERPIDPLKHLPAAR